MSDRILLLYALEVGNETGCIDGTFKLMKIPFMAELASTRAGFNTFNYSFYRWTFGPFTTEIYEDADALHSLGLATSKETEPAVTDKGRKLLSNVEELLTEGRAFTEYVRESAREFAQMKFGELKDKVYQEIVLVNGKNKYTIGNAPRGSSVLTPLANATSFELDDDWVDTLWGQFNYSAEDLASRSVIHV